MKKTGKNQNQHGGARQGARRKRKEHGKTYEFNFIPEVERIGSIHNFV